jgi:hypothetical protein
MDSMPYIFDVYIYLLDYKPKVTMTAVELLVERLAENGILHSSDIAEANELFKQQMINAWENGYREFYDGSSTPEEYYIKTFKSE